MVFCFFLKKKEGRRKKEEGRRELVFNRKRK
jgi:hypothetical protein